MLWPPHVCHGARAHTHGCTVPIVWIKMSFIVSSIWTFSSQFGRLQSCSFEEVCHWRQTLSLKTRAMSNASFGFLLGIRCVRSQLFLLLCSNDDQVLPLWDRMSQNILKFAIVMVFYHSCRKVTNTVVPEACHLRSQWTPHMCMHTQQNLSLGTILNTVYLKDTVNQKKKWLPWWVVKSAPAGSTCRFPQLPQFIVAVLTGYISQ